MPNRLRRFLVVVISTMALFAIFTVGAHAYTYPSMPSDWQDVQVTIGYGDEAVTLPLARYPSGAYFSPEKHTMTVAEQKDYGFNVGYELDVKGWQCVGFARYVFTALFYKYPQDASIDTSLAYEYSLPKAIKEGYLSPIKAQTIPLKLDISGVGVAAGSPESELSKLRNVTVMDRRSDCQWA